MSDEHDGQGRMVVAEPGAYTPTVTEVFAVVRGLGESGAFDRMREELAAAVRNGLDGVPLGRPLARLRDVTSSAAWRQSVAEDVLARLGRPLTEVDQAALEEAMGAAASAAMLELGEDLLAAIAGGA